MKRYWLKKAGRTGLYGAAALLLLVVLFIFFYPSPISPLSWEPPPRPEEADVFAQNRLLSEAELIAGPLPQPEDVVFDAEGWLYTGTADGKIYRLIFDVNGKVERTEMFAQLKGRPLGLKFDSQWNLIAAVPKVGLVSLNREGQERLLTNEADGTPITFADHLDISSSGTIYFSDASTEHYPGWPYDALEGKPHGRLLSYEPSTGDTKVLLEGLYFPNGVVLSPNEDFILITEVPDHPILAFWGASRNDRSIRGKFAHIAG